MRARWIAAIAVLLLVACASSPPTRFYTLEPVGPRNPEPKTASIDPVKVYAVHVAPVLDRKEMLRADLDDDLVISSQDRWGASLDETIRRVLTQDLQTRLPVDTVIAPNLPAPDTARGVVLDILSFAPDASGRVVLACDWSLLEGSPPQPKLRKTVQLSEPVGDSASSQARVMSHLLGRLADRIAEVLTGA